jgi:hypothetical protein
VGSRALTRSPDLQVFNDSITKLPIYQISQPPLRRVSGLFGS